MDESERYFIIKKATHLLPPIDENKRLNLNIIRLNIIYETKNIDEDLIDILIQLYIVKKLLDTGLLIATDNNYKIINEAYKSCFKNDKSIELSKESIIIIYSYISDYAVKKLKENLYERDYRVFVEERPRWHLFDVDI